MLDIYEEHLGEVAFLSSRWERALVAPDRDLSDAAEWEERLLAHVDGLVVGGTELAEMLLVPALKSEEPMEVFAAALALLESGASGWEPILATLQEGSPEGNPGIQRALELTAGLEPRRLLPLMSSQPSLQRLVLEVLAFHGTLPEGLVMEFVSHADSKLRAAAWRGLQRFPGAFKQDSLRAALESTEPEVLHAAISAGLIGNARAAWSACRKVAERHAPGYREALVLLALGGGERELGLLLELLRIPSLVVDVLWALGFCGRASAAEACLPLMAEDRTVAALAGEAFSAITGLRFEGKYLAAPETPRAEEPIPLEQEALDADLVPRPEDALQVPNPEPVAAWWQAHRTRFEQGARYLRGTPFEGSSLLAALRHEPMRRRGVLALELAIRSRGRHFVQTRAFTHRQSAEMDEAHASRSSLVLRQFDSMLSG